MGELPKKSRLMYQNIAQDLMSKIENQDYSPGEKLLPEKELARIYQVNRLTVRRAIELLIAKGLVSRRQGSGTFIKERKLDYSLDLKTSFTQNLSQIGHLPCLKILSSKVIPASAEIASFLKINFDDPVFRLKILRTAMVRKETQLSPIHPLCLSISYLIAEPFPNLSVLIYQTNSLYRLLENQYHVQPSRTKTTVETELATSEDAYLLNIQAGSPLLITKSLVCNQNNQIFEYTITRLRGDILALEIAF